jgi:hypothetical protein
MRGEVHHISENGGVPTMTGGDMAAQPLSNLLFKTFSHLKLFLNFKTLNSKTLNPKPQTPNSKTLNPKPEIQNSNSNPNPKPKTPNP